MNNLEEYSHALRESVKKQLADYEERLDAALKSEAEAVEKLHSKEASTDHSENAVYQAAHDDYLKAQSDIAMYSTRCDLLKAFDLTYIPTDTIGLKTTVAFELLDYTGHYDKNYIMLLVPPGLGNAELNLLDIESPLGRSIYKHKAGETVEYTSLLGTKRVKIKEIY